ncbi:hypothetical protein BD311DRAFT_809650 [Dichomitus squalens]|uniref:Uncharacterized protein n=1 Tax=Dichomitus squalens TaxID=114155 RepID=A0A4Q9MCA9_9APHY|nr:hypothetical protein BD311DRAFT_809650 [Dichomitus squalens]
MSSTNDYSTPSRLPADAPPPAHHLHKSSDVLPGARGANQQQQSAPPDYSADVTESPEAWKSKNERAFGAGTDTHNVMAGGQFDRIEEDDDAERPLGVQPTAQGGVAVGGRSDLPETHASMTDKLIGKTQKVTGKITRNPEMHEKGELREAGGKAAVQGEARAPHD